MDQSFSSDSEAEPLLSTLPKVSVPIRRRLFYVNLLPRGLCLPSKTAVLVLLWTLVVSAIYSTVTDSVAVAVETVSYKIHSHITMRGKSITVFFTYLSFVLASLFFPLTGYMADVHIGRYKAVIISLILLLCAAVCFSMDAILYLSHVITSDRFNGRIVKNPRLFITFVAIGYIFSAIGLAGYRANHIQFGLDQLLEAPNEYQGLFVHWILMFTVLGFAVVETLMAWYKCQYTIEAKDTVLGSQIIIVFLLILLLFIAYCLRGSFYSRNVRDNPYKIVCKVLHFIRKRKHPFQRSAFNYFDDDYASKIDFAKEIYGGPFTTEQAEDVKTFLRILIVLLVLGPVFILDIPSTAVFSVFAQHFTTNEVTDINTNCTLTWAILDSGALKYVSATVFMVMYIWFIYSFLRNCIPKIFIRLWIAHFLFVAGAVSMLLIDVSGHIIYYSREKKGAMCMFYSKVLNNYSPGVELGMHWGVLILPNLLMGIGQLLIMTNAYEFISAQSPHSMTGLFIGLFLAIRGFFQFLGAVVLYPFFSINEFWKSNQQPVLTCGFGYLLFTCSAAILSLVLLTIVAKRYKFRERNVPNINHMYVEGVSVQ